MIEKSEIKRAIFGELGTQIEQQAETLTAERHRCQGAKAALQLAAQKIATLHAVVDREIEDGTSPVDARGAGVIKKYITRAVEWVSHMATQAQTQELTNLGRVEQAHATIGALKKLYDAEQAKIEAVAAAMQKGTITIDPPAAGPHLQAVPPVEPLRGDRRPDGVHPGPSSLDARREEARARRAAQEAPQTPPPAPVTPAKVRRPRRVKA